jgi:hypothetical protein
MDGPGGKFRRHGVDLFDLIFEFLPFDYEVAFVGLDLIASAGRPGLGGTLFSRWRV